MPPRSRSFSLAMELLALAIFASKIVTAISSTHKIICDRLSSLFNNDSDGQSILSAVNYSITLEHQFFDVANGFIPDIEYEVIVQLSNDRPSVGVVVGARGTASNAQRITVPVLLQPGVVSDPIYECDTAMVNVTSSQTTARIVAPSSGADTLQIAAIIDDGGRLIGLVRTWRRRTGCFVVSSATTGTISSNHPLWNSNQQATSCTVIIQAPRQYRVRLQFTTFQSLPSALGSCDRGVLVRSDARESTMTRMLCGDYADQLKSLNFTSTTNILVLEIRGSWQEAWNKFSAFFYSLPNNTCDGKISQISGSATSPGYPMAYAPNLNCIVDFKPPPELPVTRLEVSNLDIPCGMAVCDANYVSVCTSSDDSLVDKLYRNLGGDRFVYESINLRLNFVSDFSSQGVGFAASFQSFSVCQNEEQVITQNVHHYAVDFGSGFDGRCSKVFYTNRFKHLVEIEILKLTILSNSSDSFISIFDGRKNDLSGDLNVLDNAVYRSTASSISLMVTSIKGTTSTFRAKWTVRAAPMCPEDWYPVSLTACASVYYVALNWTDAADFCVAQGGYLLKTDDIAADEIKALFGIGKVDQAYWIGANDRSAEGSFTWQDGSSVQKTEWFEGWPDYNYYGRQPTDDGVAQEDCVELRTSFPYPDSAQGEGQVSMPRWNDNYCSTKNAYICQIARGVAVTKVVKKPGTTHDLLREPFWLGVLIVLCIMAIATCIHVLRKKYGLNFKCISSARKRKTKTTKSTERVNVDSDPRDKGDTTTRRRSSLAESLAGFSNLGFRSKTNSLSSQDSYQQYQSEIVKNEPNPETAARFFASLNEVQQSSFASNDSDDQTSVGPFGTILRADFVPQVTTAPRSPFLDSFLHPDDALKRNRSDRTRRSMLSRDDWKKSHSFDAGLSRENDETTDIGLRCASDDNLCRRTDEIEIYIETPSDERKPWKSSSWRRKRFAMSPQTPIGPDVSTDDDDGDFFEHSLEDIFEYSKATGHQNDAELSRTHSDVPIQTSSEYLDEDDYGQIRSIGEIKPHSLTVSPRRNLMEEKFCLSELNSPSSRPRKSGNSKTSRVKPRSSRRKARSNALGTVPSRSLNSISTTAEVHSSSNSSSANGDTKSAVASPSISVNGGRSVLNERPAQKPSAPVDSSHSSVGTCSDDSCNLGSSSSGVGTIVNFSMIAETTEKTTKADSDSNPPHCKIPHNSGFVRPRNRTNSRRKHPYKDSAYQTKDNSISKPTSRPLSPTVSSIDVDENVSDERSSDSSFITGQLKEAALRLASLDQETGWRRHDNQHYELQTINETTDHSTVNGYVCPFTTRSNTVPESQHETSLISDGSPALKALDESNVQQRKNPILILARSPDDCEGYLV